MDTGAEDTTQQNGGEPLPMPPDSEFQIGDMVWAKIGKYPFWPSIVCEDPDSKTHVKGSTQNIKKCSLHVRFCNDNGRRSWARILETFEGKDKLISKYPNCLAFIKNSKKQLSMWDTAVNEAENWLKFDREERWKTFSIAYKIKSLPSPSKSNPSSSCATTSNNSSVDDTITRKINSNSATHNVPDSPNTLKKVSVNPQKKDVIKKKVIKKAKPKTKKQNRLDNFYFTHSAEKYHINDDEIVLPSPHRKKLVSEQLKCEIEKLEAEGILKIREWKASKLAKAASSSNTLK